MPEAQHRWRSGPLGLPTLPACTEASGRGPAPSTRHPWNRLPPCPAPSPRPTCSPITTPSRQQLRERARLPLHLGHYALIRSPPSGLSAPALAPAQPGGRTPSVAEGGSCSEGGSARGLCRNGAAQQTARPTVSRPRSAQKHNAPHGKPRPTAQVWAPWVLGTSRILSPHPTPTLTPPPEEQTEPLAPENWGEEAVW